MKIYLIILIFLTSILVGNSANEYVNIECDISVNENGVIFGDLNPVDCDELPELKEYSKPYNVQPETREIRKVEKKITIIESQYSVKTIDKSVTFGEKEICDRECEVEVREYNKPNDSTPNTLSNRIVNFIKDCFFLE